MRRWSLLLGLVGMLGSQAALATEPYGTPATRSIHQTPEEEAVEHAHGPRHGGYFGDADDLYHYEVLLEPSRRLSLYVNDEDNLPLNVRPLEGRWILNPDDPFPVTGRFTPSEDGTYLLAQLPAALRESPVHVKVEVLKGSAWAGMEFFLPAATE